MVKGKDMEFCMVTEHKVDGKSGKVACRMLGSLELVRGDCGKSAEPYALAVCGRQMEGDVSVVMVVRGRYGTNEAAFVCESGLVTRREGASGCFRADELIGEFVRKSRPEYRSARDGGMNRPSWRNRNVLSENLGG